MLGPDRFRKHTAKEAAVTGTGTATEYGIIFGFPQKALSVSGAAAFFAAREGRFRPIHPPQSAGFRILQRQGPPEREDGQPLHNFYENGLTSGKAGRILCPRC